MTQLHAPRWRTALLAVGLLLPPAQSVQALDLYYARAIGQEYSPEPPPAAPVPERDAPPAAATELPALGAGAEEERARGEMSLWSKVLIGVVLVAAVAALGNGDGGSAQVSATPGAAPEPAPPAGPAAQSGGDAGNSAGPAGGEDGAGGGSGGGGAPMPDTGAGPAPSSAPADPGAGQGPVETAAPGPSGPPAGVPGADNGRDFDFDVGDNRVHVDLDNRRVEFERGNGRERGEGRGRGRGRGGDD